MINTLSVNEEGVLFSGGDNGSLTMWDYQTGKPFQHMSDVPQPGSLDAEAVSILDCISCKMVLLIFFLLCRVCSALLSTGLERG
jgi:WD40 repeat protein